MLEIDIIIFWKNVLIDYFLLLHTSFLLFHSILLFYFFILLFFFSTWTYVRRVPLYVHSRITDTVNKHRTYRMAWPPFRLHARPIVSSIHLHIRWWRNKPVIKVFLLPFLKVFLLPFQQIYCNGLTVHSKIFFI